MTHATKRIEMKRIRPSQIKIDHHYQRELDEPRARRIASNLDISLLGVPEIACRPDNTYVAIDAQHRLYACVLAGYDEPIVCRVHYGLTRAEEAELFRKLNNNRKGLRTWADYKAGREHGDVRICEIDRIVQKAGLKVGPAATMRTIVAIAALQSVHRGGNLPDTLDVLNAWGQGDPSYFEARLLKGMSAFLRCYGDLVDKDNLLKKLGKYPPARVLSRIRWETKINDQKIPQAGEAIFRDFYNERLSKKRQLPPPKTSRSETPDEDEGVDEGEGSA